MSGKQKRSSETGHGARGAMMDAGFGELRENEFGIALFMTEAKNALQFMGADEEPTQRDTRISM